MQCWCIYSAEIVRELYPEALCRIIHSSKRRWFFRMVSVCAHCLLASPFGLRLRTLRRQWGFYKSGNKESGSAIADRASTTPGGKGSPGIVRMRWMEILFCVKIDHEKFMVCTNINNTSLLPFHHRWDNQSLLSSLRLPYR